MDRAGVGAAETAGGRCGIARARGAQPGLVVVRRDYYEQRFSPLHQINDKNVAQLGLTWQFETATQRGLEATPLVVDGVMYATGSWSVTYAIDARTGRQLWKYDPEVHRKYDNIACCDVVNRGAAFYKAGLRRCARRPARGDRCGERQGRLQTTTSIRPAYTITRAPRIAKGKIIIGNAAPNTACALCVRVRCRDGKLAWRFYTYRRSVEAAENKALDRAFRRGRQRLVKYGGGGTVWIRSSTTRVDLLYVGTGNGSTWNRDGAVPAAAIT